MVRHAPIHRRSGHSDIAICCGRNVRGSSLSTSVVPLSNQVTTLNHKRFKGFKMFSDGHLGLQASRLHFAMKLVLAAPASVLPSFDTALLSHVPGAGVPCAAAELIADAMSK